MAFRNFLFIFMLFFTLVWTLCIYLFVLNIGVDDVMALNLGATIGMLFGMIVTGWQFYFRKKPSEDEAPQSKSTREGK
ncbi:MAG: hypothetical protein LLF82_000309 [Dehalococcoides mccartyi]|uniref:hypothetical protein n=1 Tax=Dehalococcoides mccartyi TaxID=61435 RepID=UPI00242F948A|nr:hypothetical protein [Dehalococcoides mccartyi]MCF7634843.1 hypothetical protein [Dehalococcoides mccartyi]